MLIAVRDNGAGIAPKFIAHMFERFRHGDAPTSRAHGGLCLGPSIVEHLIEQHGGAVRARVSASIAAPASPSRRQPPAPS